MKLILKKIRLHFTILLFAVPLLFLTGENTFAQEKVLAHAHTDKELQWRGCPSFIP